MKKLLGVLASTALVGSAWGADLPRKAPVMPLAVPGCTIDYCVGFYAGMGYSGITNNLNVVGNGFNGSIAAGGSILDLHAGYRLWNGKLYAAGEVVGSYDAAMGTTGIGTSFSSRASSMELFKLGGSLSSLLGTQPITFPVQLQPYLMSLYGITGMKQRMGSNGTIGGMGAEFILGPNASFNLEYLNVQYSGGGATDTVGLAATSENLVRLSFNYDF